jgi:hypothetical protein
MPPAADAVVGVPALSSACRRSALNAEDGALITQLNSADRPLAVIITTHDGARDIMGCLAALPAALRDEGTAE